MPSVRIEPAVGQAPGDVQLTVEFEIAVPIAPLSDQRDGGVAQPAEVGALGFAVACQIDHRRSNSEALAECPTKYDLTNNPASSPLSRPETINASASFETAMRSARMNAIAPTSKSSNVSTNCSSAWERSS